VPYTSLTRPLSKLALLVLACFMLLVNVPVSRAGTIIKLNLGGVGPDVALNGGGILSTINDGIPGTVGDQNTAVEFTDFLNFLPDINTSTASFTLQGMAATGPAFQLGTLAIQSFSGGQFFLYDPANVLLLQGPLINSALTGVVGPPGTGAVFSTTLSTVTGGTLLPLIAPGTLSLSMNLTNVSGGNGFLVVPPGQGVLQPFEADASVNIAANPVPEPSTVILFGLGIAGVALFRHRRR